MNKKDFIQALGVGVAFGLIIYCLMMVAVHFIDKELREYYNRTSKNTNRNHTYKVT